MEINATAPIIMTSTLTYSYIYTLLIPLIIIIIIFGLYYLVYNNANIFTDTLNNSNNFFNLKNISNIDNGSIGNISSINSNSNSNSNNNGKINILSNIFLILIIIIVCGLIAAHSLYYFFSINVFTSIKNLFSQNPILDIEVNETSTPNNVPENRLRQQQVFNIPGNTYEYTDAKAVCQAYGARLATYTEIEDAYKNGAEWCNYGWTDEQMALFPTQTSTFNMLQKIPEHEHDCGRIGINGGYMANPKLKFGVNCYGYKPDITNTEDELMKTTPAYPITKKDIAFQERVDYWKTQITNVLVSPFNHTNWYA